MLLGLVRAHRCHYSAVAACTALVCAAVGTGKPGRIHPRQPARHAGSETAANHALRGSAAGGGDGAPRFGSTRCRRRFAGIGYHQAAAGLAVIGLVDDLDRRRLAPPLSLGRVVPGVHGHPLGRVGVVSATLDSALLAGGSRIPQLHGRDVGDGRTGRLSLEPGA